MTTIHTRHLKIQHVQKVNNTTVRKYCIQFLVLFPTHILVQDLNKSQDSSVSLRRCSVTSLTLRFGFKLTRTGSLHSRRSRCHWPVWRWRQKVPSKHVDLAVRIHRVTCNAAATCWPPRKPQIWCHSNCISVDQIFYDTPVVITVYSRITTPRLVTPPLTTTGFCAFNASKKRPQSNDKNWLFTSNSCSSSPPKANLNSIPPPTEASAESAQSNCPWSYDLVRFGWRRRFYALSAERVRYNFLPWCAEEERKQWMFCVCVTVPTCIVHAVFLLGACSC